MTRHILPNTYTFTTERLYTYGNKTKDYVLSKNVPINDEEDLETFPNNIGKGLRAFPRNILRWLKTTMDDISSGNHSEFVVLSTNTNTGTIQKNALSDYMDDEDDVEKVLIINETEDKQNLQNCQSLTYLPIVETTKDAVTMESHLLQQGIAEVLRAQTPYEVMPGGTLPTKGDPQHLSPTTLNRYVTNRHKADSLQLLSMERVKRARIIILADSTLGRYPPGILHTDVTAIQFPGMKTLEILPIAIELGKKLPAWQQNGQLILLVGVNDFNTLKLEKKGQLNLKTIEETLYNMAVHLTNGITQQIALNKQYLPKQITWILPWGSNADNGVYKPHFAKFVNILSNEIRRREHNFNIITIYDSLPMKTDGIHPLPPGIIYGLRVVETTMNTALLFDVTSAISTYQMYKLCWTSAVEIRSMENPMNYGFVHNIQAQVNLQLEDDTIDSLSRMRIIYQKKHRAMTAITANCFTKNQEELKNQWENYMQLPFNHAIQWIPMYAKPITVQHEWKSQNGEEQFAINLKRTTMDIWNIMGPVTFQEYIYERLSDLGSHIDKRTGQFTGKGSSMLTKEEIFGPTFDTWWGPQIAKATEKLRIIDALALLATFPIKTFYAGAQAIKNYCTAQGGLTQDQFNTLFYMGGYNGFNKLIDFCITTPNLASVYKSRGIILRTEILQNIRADEYQNFGRMTIIELSANLGLHPSLTKELLGESIIQALWGFFGTCFPEPPKSWLDNQFQLFHIPNWIEGKSTRRIIDIHRRMPQYRDTRPTAWSIRRNKEKTQMRAIQNKHLPEVLDWRATLTTERQTNTSLDILGKELLIFNKQQEYDQQLRKYEHEQKILRDNNAEKSRQVPHASDPIVAPQLRSILTHMNDMHTKKVRILAPGPVTIGFIPSKEQLLPEQGKWLGWHHNKQDQTMHATEHNPRKNGTTIITEKFTSTYGYKKNFQIQKDKQVLDEIKKLTKDTDFRLGNIPKQPPISIQNHSYKGGTLEMDTTLQTNEATSTTMTITTTTSKLQDPMVEKSCGGQECTTGQGVVISPKTLKRKMDIDQLKNKGEQHTTDMKVRITQPLYLTQITGKRRKHCNPDWYIAVQNHIKRLPEVIQEDQHIEKLLQHIGPPSNKDHSFNRLDISKNIRKRNSIFNEYKLHITELIWFHTTNILPWILKNDKTTPMTGEELISSEMEFKANTNNLNAEDACANCRILPRIIICEGCDNHGTCLTCAALEHIWRKDDHILRLLTTGQLMYTLPLHGYNTDSRHIPFNDRCLHCQSYNGLITCKNDYCLQENRNRLCAMCNALWPPHQQLSDDNMGDSLPEDRCINIQNNMEGENVEHKLYEAHTPSINIIDSTSTLHETKTRLEWIDIQMQWQVGTTHDQVFLVEPLMKLTSSPKVMNNNSNNRISQNLSPIPPLQTPVEKYKVITMIEKMDKSVPMTMPLQVIVSMLTRGICTIIGINEKDETLYIQPQIPWKYFLTSYQASTQNGSIVDCSVTKWVKIVKRQLQTDCRYDTQRNSEITFISQRCQNFNQLHGYWESLLKKNLIMTTQTPITALTYGVCQIYPGRRLHYIDSNMKCKPWTTMEFHKLLTPKRYVDDTNSIIITIYDEQDDPTEILEEKTSKADDSIIVNIPKIYSLIQTLRIDEYIHDSNSILNPNNLTIPPRNLLITGPFNKLIIEKQIFHILWNRARHDEMLEYCCKCINPVEREPDTKSRQNQDVCNTCKIRTSTIFCTPGRQHELIMGLRKASINTGQFMAMIGQIISFPSLMRLLHDGRTIRYLSSDTWQVHASPESKLSRHQNRSFIPEEKLIDDSWLTFETNFRNYTKIPETYKINKNTYFTIPCAAVITTATGNIEEPSVVYRAMDNCIPCHVRPDTHQILREKQFLRKITMKDFNIITGRYTRRQDIDQIMSQNLDIVKYQKGIKEPLFIDTTIISNTISRIASLIGMQDKEMTEYTAPRKTTATITRNEIGDFNFAENPIFCHENIKRTHQKMVGTCAASFCDILETRQRRNMTNGKVVYDQIPPETTWIVWDARETLATTGKYPDDENTCIVELKSLLPFIFISQNPEFYTNKHPCTREQIVKTLTKPNHIATLQGSWFALCYSSRTQRQRDIQEHSRLHQLEYRNAMLRDLTRITLKYRNQNEKVFQSFERLNILPKDYHNILRRTSQYHSDNTFLPFECTNEEKMQLLFTRMWCFSNCYHRKIPGGTTKQSKVQYNGGFYRASEETIIPVVISSNDEDSNHDMDME